MECVYLDTQRVLVIQEEEESPSSSSIITNEDKMRLLLPASYYYQRLEEEESSSPWQPTKQHPALAPVSIQRWLSQGNPVLSRSAAAHRLRCGDVVSSSVAGLNRARRHKPRATMSDAGCWKTAVDPKSGRTYYYHSKTRETQWNKPIELATTEEIAQAEQNDKQQREFFAAMEANILKGISEGMYKASPKQAQQEEEVADPPITTTTKPKLVRTISSMDERVLAEMVQRQPSHRNLQQQPQEALMLTIPERQEESSPKWEDDEEDETARPSRPSFSYSLATSNTSSSCSIKSLLNGLPNDTNDAFSYRNSFRSLNVSTLSLGLTSEECLALQDLAAVSDEMAHAAAEESAPSEEGSSLKGLDLVSTEPRTTLSLIPESSFSHRGEEEYEDDESPFSSGRRTMMMSRLENDHTQDLLPSTPSPPLSDGKPSIIQNRRNTCGTLYVSSTLSAPDTDATIKCVCGVYRAHILQSQQLAEQEEEDDDTTYAIFDDNIPNNDTVPSLEDITVFYRDIFRRSRIEADCIIMSLVYVERLIKLTDGKLRPTTRNWRSLVFSCLTLASKVWDDLSMWNADFSQTCPGGVVFSLQRVNELEVALLSALEYNVKVPASEYAKYYFFLRSMLIKSGLASDEFLQSTPLDVEGARRLEHVSTMYRNNTKAIARPGAIGIRSKSIGALQGKRVGADLVNASLVAADQVMRTPKVGLEHVVKM